MEDDASGKAELLLARIRALARRGAMLRRQADGTGTIEQTSPRRPGCATVTPEEFLRMIDRGWLRQEGADHFVISRGGATALRNQLNRPAAQRTVTSVAIETTAPSPSARAPSKPQLNLRESPLAWLAQRHDKDGRSLISAEELAAGERLRADFERAQLGPRVTASWNAAALPSRQMRGAPGVGMEMADVVVAARQRVEAALAAVGPELADVLIDVCCFLKGLEQAERNGGWPRRAGKVVLQLALKQLARHYGILPGPGSPAQRIRHWSSPDYRPAANAPAEDQQER